MTELTPDAAPLPRRQPTQGEAAARDSAAASSLPRRTSSVRRVGRHRSAHRISVASDAPALVLAIPGSGRDADAELADQIAEATTESCPGVEIRIGFLGSDIDNLRDALSPYPSDQPGLTDRPGLSDLAGPSSQLRPAGVMDLAPKAVVVPLLAGPHPLIDQQLATILSEAHTPVMLAAHLGPHPLLAAALHDRLSEVGLARASRARGLNIAAGANGVLVVAGRGPSALNDAGVTAVLLAARLAVPVLPASLDDAAGIMSALERLRDAGATHPAIAPCLIGPETDPGDLAQLSNALDAPCAAPLGAHPAVAQLVAVRYGEALTRISVSSH